MGVDEADCTECHADLIVEEWLSLSYIPLIELPVLVTRCADVTTRDEKSKTATALLRAPETCRHSSD